MVTSTGLSAKARSPEPVAQADHHNSPDICGQYWRRAKQVKQQFSWVLSWEVRLCEGAGVLRIKSSGSVHEVEGCKPSWRENEFR